MYDDWLRHRAVWRRYATPASLMMVIRGASISLQFQQEWLVGFVIGSVGVFEIIASLTHRRQWINERISDVRDDKTVDLTFDVDWAHFHPSLRPILRDSRSAAAVARPTPPGNPVDSPRESSKRRSTITPHRVIPCRR